MKDVAAFNGDSNDFCRFWASLQVFFQAQPHRYQTDSQKIAYAYGCLEGPAAQWAANLYSQPDSKEVFADTATFESRFRTRFEDKLAQDQADYDLRHFKQGSSNLAQHLDRFEAIRSRSTRSNENCIENLMDSLRMDLRNKVIEVAEDVPSLKTHLEKLKRRLLLWDQLALTSNNKNGRTQHRCSPHLMIKASPTRWFQWISGSSLRREWIRKIGRHSFASA